MSDFLENLVARSLSDARTVRPQVLSIFEPPPANSGAIFRGSTAPEQPIVEHEMENPTAERLGQLQSLWRGTVEQGAMAVDPLLPHSAPSEKTQGRVAGDPITVTPPSHAEPLPSGRSETLPGAVTRKRAGVARVTIDEISGLKPANANDSLDEGAPAHSVRATRPEPRLRTDEPAKSPPTRPFANLFTPVKPEGKRSDPRPAVIEKEITGTIIREHHVHDEPAPARETQTAQLRPASGTRIVPAQQPKALSFAPIVPASIIVSPRVLPTPPHDEDATEAPPVHVTIGRVEVRATLPPPVPSPPQAASAPVMSLDEYLRQRAAGGR